MDILDRFGLRIEENFLTDEFGDNPENLPLSETSFDNLLSGIESSLDFQMNDTDKEELHALLCK